MDGWQYWGLWTTILVCFMLLAWDNAVIKTQLNKIERVVCVDKTIEQ